MTEKSNSKESLTKEAEIIDVEQKTEEVPLENNESNAKPKESTSAADSTKLELTDNELSIEGGKEQEKDDAKKSSVDSAPSQLDGKNELTDNTKDADNEECPPLPTRRKTTEDVSEGLQKPRENPILTQLKEAFPNIEEKYVKAVIIASQGVLDPAFNALLYLSDPDAEKDIELPTDPIKEPPTLPTRKTQDQRQLEQDELLARQLNEQYNRTNPRQKQRPSNEPRRQRRTEEDDRPRNSRYGVENDIEDDSWGQFVEKDLPEITARANRSLQETASKVGSWFSKNIIGEEDESMQQREKRNPAGFTDDDIREQQKAWSYYQNEKKMGKKTNNTVENVKPERRRFNSFGAQVGEDSLENHGISLLDNDDDNEFGDDHVGTNDDDDDDDDVPPQLPSRERSRDSDGKGSIQLEKTPTVKKNEVVAQTTLIDTPEPVDTKQQNKWTPVAPEPLNATPTKVNVVSKDKKPNSLDDEDDFLINSDDEL
ncbi:ubiquitin-binding protein CUE5 NDAI_0F00740 [Naumovozyma dairenensis CBS 421]|uniref:CUE domain-containing protein n=1 Tax=Naumovozyma dairenensis (strain ATCC 10597 / BCRC 20456 / CBS 421 / NBRC 0211 / NRRL Y-12639) TaxID=1071378 RepID=G0WC82_NAUDC|nr:hypothetical protein NDAI_0F00740 [Naumovozyma dairenensis CBS 421]CCD25393.1 hypothetical protein NDAI_0F00740 [Naumovozyma dairenensis CBS 421]